MAIPEIAQNGQFFGITFQIDQRAAAQVSGLVIFGEDNGFFARHSRKERLAVVFTLRI